VEAAKSTTSRLFGCNTETPERYVLSGDTCPTPGLWVRYTPFSGGGLVVGAGCCLQCCRRQRSAGLGGRASGELGRPSFNAARSAVCAAALWLVSGRSAPAP